MWDEVNSLLIVDNRLVGFEMSIFLINGMVEWDFGVVFFFKWFKIYWVVFLVEWMWFDFFDDVFG